MTGPEVVVVVVVVVVVIAAVVVVVVVCCCCCCSHINSSLQCRPWSQDRLQCSSVAVRGICVYLYRIAPGQASRGSCSLSCFFKSPSKTYARIGRQCTYSSTILNITFF